MLTSSAVSTYLGYSVSAITFVCGIAVVSGLVLGNVPAQLRVMFGIVLILWGIYRFVVTRFRMRQQNDQENAE
jgi:succinate-acetate transporter protein